MARTRLISLPLAVTGYAHKHTSLTDTHLTWTDLEKSIYPYESHKCIDEVNKRDNDNPLTITFEGRLFVPLNGRVDTSPTSYYEFVDWVPKNMAVSLGHGLAVPSMIPSVGTVATSVLARSNPSRPSLSLPNFLYELKDLPGMIRDIGNLKRQAHNIRMKGVSVGTNSTNAANHLLSYQMGWRPLISDLRKLVDFQSQVDKKMRELQNLYSNGGLQRRVRSPEWQASADEILHSSQTAQSSITTSITHRVSRFTMIERWGTVRWIPTALPDPRFSSKKMAKLARDLTFGLHGLHPKQVWDAIPWTWLVGWFTNADEYIQAHNNSIPLRHSVPCIMTRTISKYSWVRTDSNTSILGGNGDAGYSTKERVINGGTLSASIPFLNGRQLSILGALAIQRRR